MRPRKNRHNTSDIHNRPPQPRKPPQKNHPHTHMFRKLRKPEEDPPPTAFPETFWHWYADSYNRLPLNHAELTDTLPHNQKKYSLLSLSVSQLKGFFSSQPELPQPSTHQMVAMLKSPFTMGDTTKAYHMARFFQLSEAGFFITNDGFDCDGNIIQYCGAENWENVMCYMDALLFSMFANLESFEPMLFVLNTNNNPMVHQLSGLLRVYVNLMRLGNLITTDVTARLCECLFKLGYDEALSHRQQDAAQLFEFLTETLMMPLLTFKVEIQHLGKHETDDTKYSKERILFVSVPNADSSATPVKTGEESDVPDADHDEHDAVLLEECLEHYFNNSISVKRELQRRATIDLQTPRDEIIENPDKQDTPETIENTETQGSRPRANTLSMWSTHKLEANHAKEVMLPAWMFLRLLPFYTDDNELDHANESIARNSKEFVTRRPVLPICLKRYSFDAHEQLASRSNKRIIIPPVIDLPSFVADDVDTENTGAFKLVLESALCHRGTTIALGHFVSAVRKNIGSVDDNMAAEWYLYDDLKKQRVVTKTFREIFDKEWPYMLFYRLVSATDVDGSSAASSQKLAVIPKGSRAQYWQEDPLLPILSRKNSNNDHQSDRSSLLRLIGAESLSNSPFSVPLPEVPPKSPDFVDIRQKYLWYVIDENKNYYKESASLSTLGLRKLSIARAPQFRRNSQWSLKQEEPKEKPDRLRNFLTRKSDDSEEKEQQQEQLQLHHHHHHLFFNSEKKDPPLLSKKEHWKRRLEYKNEKCTIV